MGIKKMKERGERGYLECLNCDVMQFRRLKPSFRKKSYLAFYCRKSLPEHTGNTFSKVLFLFNITDPDLTFMGPCIVIIFQYISKKMQRYTVYYIWKLLYMFRVVLPPIIRSANNCIDSILYLSRPYCHLPLSWKSWNRFESAVGGVRHPQHTKTSSNLSTIAAGSSNGVINIRCCRYSCLRS